MIYKLNTSLVPIFSGTYETLWDIEETDNDGNELPVSYDTKEMLKSIAKAYDNNADYIKDELGIDWIKAISFPGGTYSPREYNFSTDSLDMNVDVNYRLMLKYLASLEGNQEFTDWLHEQYSSRDGFISFTPDNWHEMRRVIYNHDNDKEQAVGALIRWAGTQANPDNFGYAQGVEEYIWEEWRGNGYGGTDYWVECAECYKKMEYDMDGEYHCANEECVINKTIGLSK